MKTKKKKNKKKTLKMEAFPYLLEGRFEQIEQDYSLFRIVPLPSHQGMIDFSQQLQRISPQRLEGIKFSTSSSSFSPFPKK